MNAKTAADKLTFDKQEAADKKKDARAQETSNDNDSPDEGGVAPRGASGGAPASNQTSMPATQNTSDHGPPDERGGTPRIASAPGQASIPANRSTSNTEPSAESSVVLVMRPSRPLRVVRPAPRPSRQQKDNELALANIKNFLQQNKKVAPSSVPGPNVARFKASLARKKKAESELDYRLRQARDKYTNGGPSCSGDKSGDSAPSEGPSVEEKGKAVDHSAASHVSELGSGAVDGERDTCELDLLDDFPIGSLSVEEDIYGDEEPGRTNIEMNLLPPLHGRIEKSEFIDTRKRTETTAQQEPSTSNGLGTN